MSNLTKLLDQKDWKESWMFCFDELVDKTIYKHYRIVSGLSLKIRRTIHEKRDGL